MNFVGFSCIIRQIKKLEIVMKKRYLIVLTFVGLVLLGVGAFSLFDFGSKQIIADDATQEQVPLDGRKPKQRSTFCTL